MCKNTYWSNSKLLSIETRTLQSILKINKNEEIINTRLKIPLKAMKKENEKFHQEEEK